MLHLLLRFNSWARSLEFLYVRVSTCKCCFSNRMPTLFFPSQWRASRPLRDAWYRESFRIRHGQCGESVRMRMLCMSDSENLSGSKTQSCGPHFCKRRGALHDERSWVGSCACLWHVIVKSWLQNVKVLKILLESNFKRNLPWQSVVNHANVCRSRVNKTNR